MTDQLNTAHAQTEALMSLLAVRALEDYAGAVMQSPSLEPPISGTGTATATETALERLAHAATYNKVLHTFQRVVRILTDLHHDITPTGAQCRTVAYDDQGRRVECERIAIVRGYCHKCWPHTRNGTPPDAPLLRKWNLQIDRDCICTADDCPHPPGRCLNRIQAGIQARTCGTCRNRKSAA